MNHNWQSLSEKHLKYFGVEGVRLDYFGLGVEAYALVENDEPLFILVFVFVAPGTASVTLSPGPKIYEMRRKVLVAIREDVEEYALVKNLMRLEANTLNERKYISFMKRCGFEMETILKKFYNGEDRLSWVMFPKVS